MDRLAAKRGARLTTDRLAKRRLARRALVMLAIVAGCAKATTNPILGSGGSGGGTGGALIAAVSAVGVGGIPNDEAGAPPVDAGACVVFTETFTQSCLGCLAASCCPIALTCYDASDCYGLTNCQQNCPPDMGDAGNPCLSACSQDFADAGAPYGQLTACLHASCSSVCPY
jgi:hypothetical protein